jgi:hypothetical protein
VRLLGTAQSRRWVVLLCVLAAALAAAAALSAQARIERMPQRPPDQAVPLGPAELTPAGLKPAGLAPKPQPERTVVERRGHPPETRKQRST